MLYTNVYCSRDFMVVFSMHHFLSFSILRAIFPGGPGLASTRMYPVWILLKLRAMKEVVTTGAIRRAKLQSNHHHRQTNTHFFTGRMPFLSPNQRCRSTEGNHCTIVGKILEVMNMSIKHLEHILLLYHVSE